MSDTKLPTENKENPPVVAVPKQLTGTELESLKTKLSKVHANAMKHRGKAGHNPTLALREIGWFEFEAKVLDGSVTVEEAEKIKKLPDEIDCTVKPKESLQKTKESLQSPTAT